MKRTLRKLFEYLERLFDIAFQPQNNPLLQLGAMGWFFYWVVVVSGVYLYIFFDSGVTQAYQSLEYLTHEQWYAGGIMRSLHRYASDAMVVVVFLHLIREFVMDRLHGPRYFAWITGVLLLWFLYASGISGYWIAWDKLAQYIAIATTEWLDTLPFFAEAIARNFLHDSTLSGRFFTLFVFIHIAVPLLMLFAMWVHIQRLSQPKVNPPKTLALGTLGMLLAMSFISPAVSQGQADLSQVPAEVGLDWFYLFFYPLLDHYPGLVLWGGLTGATLLLCLLPWLTTIGRKPVAVVDLKNCNGCGRCVQDCPYSAISMRGRTDGLPYLQEATVDADLCVSCGICAGACPTATPFRRQSELVPGIQLADYSIARLKEKILQLTEKLTGRGRVLVFSCDPGPRVKLDGLENSAAISLPCVAMLPPSFLDFILSRHHVDGVLIAACGENSCFHRLGDDWFRQRMNRERDPKLRGRINRKRIAVNYTGLAGENNLEKEVRNFQQILENMGEEGALLSEREKIWPN